MKRTKSTYSKKSVNIGRKVSFSRTIPYSTQAIDSSDEKAIVDALNSGWITQGPGVAKFESELASFTGARYATAVTSCTAGLHIAYLTIGLGPGDEVIVPANTFVATASMVSAVGARPIFCDIGPDGNIDPDAIEKNITSRTKAITVVHYAGAPCEMDKILLLAKKYKLKVIEDAAHAIGTIYKGKKIGSLNSDMTVFSFHPVKPMTTGEGGAVTTNNEQYFKKLKALRFFGIEQDKDGFNTMVSLGFNYKMSDILAALGSNQLKKLLKAHAKRIKLAERYFNLLKNEKRIILPPRVRNGISSWHLFPIRLSKELSKYQMNILKDMRDAKIWVQIHYPVIYLHPYYVQQGYKKGLCPKTEEFSASEISLPLYPHLSAEEQKYVIDTLKKVLNKYV